MITATANNAGDGYGRNDLTQAHTRLSTARLESQSAIGLAMVIKIASARKYREARITDGL